MEEDTCMSYAEEDTYLEALLDSLLIIIRTA